ncbi:hypothetical protein JQC92_09385 [Shewanella sp. 202IG2-18]|uniref:hypothetical protein n=1 Tax=Parashewanella hymeniacidonis TaxID=2807618 RepID=UPI0019608D0E|nr:hypothetical protein [Parashewanella hymeniacidonis]MBM7072238.1 hypothetical protein [Parashewanella hymeniacidonis]
MFTLIGCSQSLKGIKKDESVELQPEVGYLLIGLDTTLDLHTINITGTNRFKFTKEDLRAGTNFILIDIPAGNYKISEIKFNRYSRLELVEGYWDFQVAPKKINYIGTLQVEGSSWFGWLNHVNVLLNNESTQAFKFIHENFPNLLNAYRITFGGPGEDHFFEYLQSTEQQLGGL